MTTANRAELTDLLPLASYLVSDFTEKRRTLTTTTPMPRILNVVWGLPRSVKIEIRG